MRVRITDEMIERAARAWHRRDVEEDVADGTWEENEALHGFYRQDARKVVEAALIGDPIEEDA